MSLTARNLTTVSAAGVIDAGTHPARPVPPMMGVILGLGSACLAMGCAYQGIQQVIIPYQIQQIDAAHKVGNLALLITVAAALAVVGSVAGGTLSDRTRSRFGRRTPWLVAMSVVSAALMLLIGMLHDIPKIAIAYAILWGCLNFYQAVLNAVIPDRVPASRRGAVSSAFGLGSALGIGLGVNAVAHLSALQGYAAIGGLLIIMTGLCVFLLREGKSPELPNPIPTGADAFRAAAPKFSWLGLFQGFLSRDFTLAFFTRLLTYIALATVTGYTYYILQDHIGVAHLPNHDVKGAIGLLISAHTGFLIVGVAGAGWLADRLNRLKLFVGICSIGMGAAMIIPLLAPTWIAMLVFYSVVGLFFGTYSAVDLALMTLVLPSREHEGRDLAVLAIANAGPQLLSPVIAAAIISMAGYDALFLFGFVASLLAGIAVFFIRSVR